MAFSRHHLPLTAAPILETTALTPHAMNARLYHSAIDGWFYPALFFGPWFFCTVLTYLTRGSWAGALIGLGVGVVTLVASWPFTRPCQYTLSDESLSIKAGFLELTIPLTNIVKVEPVRSFLAAPCLSIFRVRLTLVDGVEMISPEDRTAFMIDLDERVARQQQTTKLS